MSATKPIRYSEDIRAEDTERAAKTVKASLFPIETKPVAVDFGGTCPRCGHPIAHREWLVTVAPAFRLDAKQMEQLAYSLDDIDIDRSHGDQTFDLTCPCAEEHPHRPPGKKGCGARFRLRVVWP
jgi:hypothetical protein